LGFFPKPQKSPKTPFLGFFPKSSKTPVLAIFVKNPKNPDFGDFGQNRGFCQKPQKWGFLDPPKKCHFSDFINLSKRKRVSLAYVQKGNIYQIEKRCFFSIFFRFF
jgi:hypothetical protein